jgi:hypothetical protein
MNVPLRVLSLLEPGVNVRGTAVREYYTKYFTSPQGSVPWQYEKV